MLEMIMELGSMNLLFILCSVPIFTIGPAYVGLLSCADAFWKQEGSSTVRTFFKRFWETFLPSAVLGVLTTLVLGVMAYNMLFTLSAFSGTVRSALVGAYILFLILVLMYFYHMARLLAHYGTFRARYLKAAFLTMLSHIPQGLLIAAAMASPLVLLFFPIGVGLSLLPVVLLFWFSTFAVLCVRISAGYLPQTLKFCEES